MFLVFSFFWFFWDLGLGGEVGGTSQICDAVLYWVGWVCKRNWIKRWGWFFSCWVDEDTFSTTLMEVGLTLWALKWESWFKEKSLWAKSTSLRDHNRIPYDTTRCRMKLSWQIVCLFVCCGNCLFLEKKLPSIWGQCY